jgi:hypothetical protein
MALFNVSKDNIERRSRYLTKDPNTIENAPGLSSWREHVSISCAIEDPSNNTSNKVFETLDLFVRIRPDLCSMRGGGSRILKSPDNV